MADEPKVIPLETAEPQTSVGLRAMPEPAKPDARGTTLGARFVLREPLGEGGMAVVWRAFDSHLKRDVALKLLHEHVLPVDRERFGREIRTLARLSHPGVITIFDLGGDGNRTFFTMELLEGGPISNLGPIEDTPEDRVLLRRILEADPEYSYTILEAATGAEGLRLWHEPQPDCILLKNQLPDADGLTLLTTINPEPLHPNLPLVIIIAPGNEALAAGFHRGGADDSETPCSGFR